MRRKPKPRYWTNERPWKLRRIAQMFRLLKDALTIRGDWDEREWWLLRAYWDEWNGSIRCALFGPHPDKDFGICVRCGLGPYTEWHEKWREAGLWNAPIYVTFTPEQKRWMAKLLSLSIVPVRSGSPNALSELDKGLRIHEAYNEMGRALDAI